MSPIGVQGEMERGADGSGMQRLDNKADDCAVIGTLKGYDQLMNLVLDEVKEAMTGMF